MGGLPGSSGGGGSSPAVPTQTQDLGQMVNSEAVVTLVNFTGSPNVILDRSRATFITVTDPALVSSITITYNVPIKSDRIAIEAGVVLNVLPTAVTITITDVFGNVFTLFTRAGAALTANGIETDSDIPRMIRSITVAFAAPGLGNDFTVSNVVIYKVTEIEAAMNRNAVETTTVINAVAVAHPIPVASTGVPAVGGLPPVGVGLSIQKENNEAINAEVIITADALIAAIDANLNWFYSDDNITWFYMATTVLDDVAGSLPSGNPNPTGFAAAAGSSQRNISHPQSGFSGFIAVTISNDDAINPITATVRLVRQR